MRSQRRIILAAAILSVVLFSALPVMAACEGGYSVPQEWESTFRYYNASGQVVGWEKYFCGGLYTARGQLHGVWMEETDIDCCTGQTQYAVFYFCQGDWWQVNYVGDTNVECSN